MQYYHSPETLLRELGIREPEDIDLEAIAYFCGVSIRLEPLKGCEARLLGNTANAIITVNSASPVGRQRFSIGHELGHWNFDRNKQAYFCQADQFLPKWNPEHPETRANRFAAGLILPKSMFQPRLKNAPVTFDTVKRLAGLFRTSQTATAIRLVELSPFPCCLAAVTSTGIAWSCFSPEVPKDKIKLRSQPGRNTYVFELLRSSAEFVGADEVSCREWIENVPSYQYRVHEHSIKVLPDLALSLLWWKDDAYVIDLEEAENDEGD